MIFFLLAGIVLLTFVLLVGGHQSPEEPYAPFLQTPTNGNDMQRFLGQYKDYPHLINATRK